MWLKSDVFRKFDPQISPLGAGTERLLTLESDVNRRQIVTFKVDPRAESNQNI